MTGRLIPDPKDRVIDVTPVPIQPAAKKKKISFFRRLVLTLLLWSLSMLGRLSWYALVHPSRTDSTFLWEFGYHLGATPWYVLMSGLLVGWFIVPLAFSPDK